MNGLPFEQLPGSDISPENIIKQRYETSRKEHQRRFNNEWNNLDKQIRILGPERLNQMQQSLYTRNQREAFDLNKQTESQINHFKEIDQLAQQGLMTNPYEVKMRMILGPETERAVFPQRKSIAAQYGEMDLYRNRLESRLAQFEMTPGGKRIKDPFKWWFQERKAGRMLKVFMGTEGTGKKAKDVFRPATQEEQQEYGALIGELQRVKELQTMTLQQPDITNRLRKAAAVGDRRMGIGESISMELERRQPTPTKSQTTKPIYQQNRRTGQQRVSYDNGATWQTL